MKIIIPMTGKSKRFKEVGINTPKQFLSIGNKTIIEHTLDMFPGEKDINFIISTEDSSDENLKNYFKKISKYNFTVIEHQKAGPGAAVLESGLLDTNDDVLINYCDFSNIWDWKNFLSFIKEKSPDGVIPAYKGLHPHNIYGNDYAFLNVSGENVIDIQEKKSFTENKINEYASSGSYYFKSGKLAKKYIENTFRLEKFINNEIYISTPYEEMIKDGLNIHLYHIDYFFQWGTPEDYKEFIYNLNEVDNIQSKKKINLNNEVNLLIPAAGESKRFKDEGYKNSKIYLDVNGSSILNTIISSFNNQLLTKVLIQHKDYLPDEVSNEKIDIIKIENKTSGQAESVYLLTDKVANDNPVLIHSSDCVLDKETKIELGDSDIVVFTKKNYRRGFEKKNNYGWINPSSGFVDSLSIKTAPTSKNSNIIIGTFLFKNKSLYEELYLETQKLNSGLKEIHVDHLVQTAVSKGLKVSEVASEKSIMLGIPIEYQLFLYMKKVYEYLNK